MNWADHSRTRHSALSCELDVLKILWGGPSERSIPKQAWWANGLTWRQGKFGPAAKDAYQPAVEVRDMPNEQNRKTGPPSPRWQYHPQALLRYVLSLDDTPHHIALGTAIGVFVGLTPTPGAQMLLVLGIYYAFRSALRFSLPAGLTAVYVSNPITALPIAWASYVIGRVFVGGELTKAELAALLEGEAAEGWWRNLLSMLAELGSAYLIGSLILALICGCLAYPAMRSLVLLFRAEPPQSPKPPSTAPAREISRTTV